MIKHKTIQYIFKKYPGIYNELKMLGLNKEKNLLYEGTLSDPNQSIWMSGVFIMRPDGQMYFLRVVNSMAEFMTPVTHLPYKLAAIGVARAVCVKHKYLLPTLNSIELIYGLPQTTLPNAAPTLNRGNTPLF